MTILVDLGFAGSAAQPGLRSSDREVLSLARSLSTQAPFSGEIAVVTHAPVLAGDPLVQELADQSVSRLFAPAESSDDLSTADTQLLGAVLEDFPAALVLATSGADTVEWFSRLAVRRGAGAAIVTDAVSLAVVDGALQAEKSVLAGSYTTAVSSRASLLFVTLKPNSVEVREVSGQASAPDVVPVSVVSDRPAASITGTSEKPVSNRPPLTEARVVVAGGRGVDGDFSQIEALADVLGGAVGASRAATDAGWIDHSAQVGQTGVTVSPQLYISAGISGAIQQRAGMQTSQVIVAINKDEDAQVFEIADFGVVGDLNSVISQALEELARRRA